MTLSPGARWSTHFPPNTTSLALGVKHAPQVCHTLATSRIIQAGVPDCREDHHGKKVNNISSAYILKHGLIWWKKGEQSVKERHQGEYLSSVSNTYSKYWSIFLGGTGEVRMEAGHCVENKQVPLLCQGQLTGWRLKSLPQNLYSNCGLLQTWGIVWNSPPSSHSLDLQNNNS